MPLGRMGRCAVLMDTSGVKLAEFGVALENMRNGEGLASLRQAQQAGYELAQFREVLAAHCPLSHHLLIPRERVTIAAYRGDRLIPFDHARALFEHWQEPRLTLLDGGHLLQADRAGMLRELLRLARA